MMPFAQIASKRRRVKTPSFLQCTCEILHTRSIRLVFAAKKGLLVESIHPRRHAAIICPVVRTEGDECFQVGHQLFGHKVCLRNCRRSNQRGICTPHEFTIIHICIRSVLMHVLHLWKVLQDKEENVVE